MAKTEAEIKAWLTSLEAERLDQSYKRPPVKYQPEIIYREKKINNQVRDRIMYHAGRYAEGARDLEAIDGHRKATRILKKEEK